MPTKEVYDTEKKAVARVLACTVIQQYRDYLKQIFKDYEQHLDTNRNEFKGYINSIDQLWGDIIKRKANPAEAQRITKNQLQKALKIIAGIYDCEKQYFDPDRSDTLDYFAYAEALESFKIFLRPYTLLPTEGFLATTIALDTTIFFEIEVVHKPIFNAFQTGKISKDTSEFEARHKLQVSQKTAITTVRDSLAWDLFINLIQSTTV